MNKYCAICDKDAEFKALSNNSHAELRGNSHAELRGNSHADCKSPYACAVLKSNQASATGRRIGDKSLSQEEYLEHCGVTIKRGYATLYKSTCPRGISYSDKNIKYTVGKRIVAPDWDASFTGECGKALHVSPTVQQAKSFNDEGWYFAVRVKVSDIAPLPAFAECPDKIRVKACKPLYRVDRDGNKIKEATK